MEKNEDLSPHSRYSWVDAEENWKPEHESWDSVTFWDTKVKAEKRNRNQNQIIIWNWSDFGNSHSKDEGDNNDKLGKLDVVHLLLLRTTGALLLFAQVRPLNHHLQTKPGKYKKTAIMKKTSTKLEDFFSKTPNLGAQKFGIWVPNILLLNSTRRRLWDMRTLKLFWIFV